MAKYEPRRRSAPKPQCGMIKHSMLVLAAFIIGYAAASFYDATKLYQWINIHLLSTETPTIAAPAQKAELPKPKFEFYTLLTQESHPIQIASTTAPGSQTSQPTPPPAANTNMAEKTIPSAESTPVSIEINTPVQSKEVNPSFASAISSKDAYLVQIASFRRPQDAEKLKASLTMKGFMVSVMSVTQQNMQWYRVVVGPFANKSEALRVQSAIAKSEKITGMVRKVDV